MKDSQKPVPLSKRQFLATTATATAAVYAWDPFVSVCQAAPREQMRLNLNGEWRVSRRGESESIPALVPGCIHTDLLAAGKIPDPYQRDNEKAVQWVGETSWVYQRSFRVSRELLAQPCVRLRCEGLDTLATIKLNGREIGRADNMFRTWEFDAKPALKQGENLIEITFASPLPLMKERQATRVLYEWSGPHEPLGRAWVRKEPCNFGWDWGPVLITCGIWRNISLEAVGRGRLIDVSVLQDHSVKDAVTLEIAIAAELLQALPFKANLALTYRGAAVGSATASLLDGQARAKMTVGNPRLWWPAGLGESALYELQVDLVGPEGRLVDRSTRRIGLRTLKLLEKDGENSLRFEVNGVAFFAKGGNWIPCDAFPTRVTQAQLRRYVTDAVGVNMNFLRFWGGGYYEEDALFDLCDEMGICVWLDFKFACSSYPAFDEAFMANVRLEARDNLRRLRHHPCIAVWCGNNEISLMVKEEWSDKSMGRRDYDKLFKVLLAGEVKDLAPQANYVSGSPDCGDIHFWEVWHGGKTFDAYRSLMGFPSEFGFQSFPVPATVRGYTAESDRSSLVTPVMDWHQRSPKGNEKIRDMTTQYFRSPRDFDSALWLSQILQGYGIKMGAEFWRQNMPRSMGCIFWQYNDCWPVASWSSVDYFGRWKALHYFARRFYAPLLVSGLEDAKKGTIDIYVTSDRLASCRGTLVWEVTDLQGKSLLQESVPLDIGSRRSQKVKTLNLNDCVTQGEIQSTLTWLKLTAEDQRVSDNLVLLASPKDLELPDPRLEPVITRVAKGFQVTLRAQKPALWAWLELEGDPDARFSDNFVHVTAGQPAEILVYPSRPIARSEFSKALRARSLIDTLKA